MRNQIGFCFAALLMLTIINNISRLPLGMSRASGAASPLLPSPTEGGSSDSRFSIYK